MRIRSYILPIVLALLVHVCVVLLLVPHWFQHKQDPRQTPRHIQATMIDLKSLATEVANQQQIAEAKEEAAQKQAEQARQAAELEKQEQAEQARQAQEAERKQQAEAQAQKKKLEEQKQQEAQKKLEELKKQEEKKNLEKQRIEEKRLKEVEDARIKEFDECIAKIKGLDITAEQKATLESLCNSKPKEVESAIKAILEKKADEAEKKKLAEEAKKKAAEKQKQEAAQKAAEAAKKKAEADKQRKAEEAKRKEAERVAAEKAAAEAKQKAELEKRRQAALEKSKQTVDEFTAYVRSEISGRWIRPATARNGMQATALVVLFPSGEIDSVEIVKSSGDLGFDRAAENAVYKVGRFSRASEIDPVLFDRNLRRIQVIFRPEGLRY
ncbi:cell envelope integrity protein TolA [Neptunomonas phycophila]|uniref:cell envelope integrity protein TolA n=1 Tax=Neptunomonas phycophila TaxID=1572645 RepID=UPI000948E314|nr:cell envelope integrity protein TolA [Neptunomonas phycophila]